MSNLPIKGKDVFLALQGDGQQIDMIPVVSFEETGETEFVQHNWLGDSVTHRSIEHKGFSGSFELENRNQEHEALVQKFIDNYHAGVRHPACTITCVVFYEDGSKGGYVYTDVVLKNTNTNPGKGETVTIRMEWEAEKRLSIA